MMKNPDKMSENELRREVKRTRAMLPYFREVYSLAKERACESGKPWPKSMYETHDYLKRVLGLEDG